MKHSSAYALCPRCWRAVPITLAEHYCVNDGALLLQACGRCAQPIYSPYTRFCSACGRSYGDPSARPS